MTKLFYVDLFNVRIDELDLTHPDLLAEYIHPEGRPHRGVFSTIEEARAFLLREAERAVEDVQRDIARLEHELDEEHKHLAEQRDRLKHAHDPVVRRVNERDLLEGQENGL